MPIKSTLEGGRELAYWQAENPLQANLIRRMIRAITQAATNAGVSPVGQADAPPTIGSVNVKANLETLHVTISDAAPIRKQINYFIEADTDPNFTAPHVEDLGASRGKFLTLPSLNDSGVAQPWYIRGYSQYPGSAPSRPVYYGGLSPTSITLTGSTRLTPLTSPGSGTASPSGQQGGQGLGLVPVRPAQGPKRNVGV
jgi:hypothetical protein